MSEIRNINVNSSHDDSEDDNSDDNLKIVLESPIRKRTDSNSSTGAEKESIESFKDKIEKSLEEKAAKTNLNAINVKTIIRKVVNNEHLVALIQDAENTEDKEVYEPKLTRAKAKYLILLCNMLQIYCNVILGNYPLIPYRLCLGLQQ